MLTLSKIDLHTTFLMYAYTIKLPYLTALKSQKYRTFDKLEILESHHLKKLDMRSFRS